MKKIFLYSLLLFAAQRAFCQLTPVEKQSNVEFKIKNFGFTVTGTFSGINGKISFDPKNLASCNFNVSVDANTVNTDNSLRDDHLRGETYFDVKKYPRISFVSTRVTNSNKEGVLFVFGKLSIKNTTKDISFPFTATPTNGGYAFKGSFTINRKDFGVGGTSIISDDLTVNLDVFTKQ